VTTAKKVKASEAGTVKMLAKERMAQARALAGVFQQPLHQSSPHSLAVHVNMSGEIEIYVSPPLVSAISSLGRLCLHFYFIWPFSVRRNFRGSLV